MALIELENELNKKKYYSISHGKVVHYLPEGGLERYKSIEGHVTDVYLKDRTFNGQKVPFWYIDIQDKNELYSVSFPFISGAFKSVILSLASCKTLTRDSWVVIEPYEKDGYTKVCVFADGQKLDWVTKELPPLKTEIYKGKEFTDDSERMGFIAKIASEVKDRVIPHLNGV